MLKYFNATTVLLAVGLSACLDEPTGPSCLDLTGEISATAGDTIVMDSGLRYIETGEGAGQIAASCTGEVTVDYTLSLSDGTVVDDGTQNLEFTIGELNYFAAFEQGIIGMGVGGARRLILAPNLAYGSVARQNQAGQVVIPANSTLIFDVELLEIN